MMKKELLTLKDIERMLSAVDTILSDEEIQALREEFIGRLNTDMQETIAKRSKRAVEPDY